jgi:peptidoglycan/xylan/chitin deacetylase (PgdA/CDA1 family)
MERAEEPVPNVLRVLTYHRVDIVREDDALDPTLVSASPETFAEQMHYLATRYKVVSLAQVMDAREQRRPLPPRSVLLTFDDGYCDFGENVWPLLKRLGLAATLFVPTALPGNPARSFWWDQLWQALRFTARRDSLDTPIGEFPLGTTAERKQAFQKIRKYLNGLEHSKAVAYVAQLRSELDVQKTIPSVLNWDELRRLAREGLTLGAHSRTHPKLDELSAKQLQGEIAGSLSDLLTEIGSALPVFAYPGGGVNEQVVQELGKNRVELAFTTVRGVNELQKADWLRLRRINIGRHTSPDLLRAKLLPQFSSLKVF